MENINYEFLFSIERVMVDIWIDQTHGITEKLIENKIKVTHVYLKYLNRHLLTTNPGMTKLYNTDRLFKKKKISLKTVVTVFLTHKEVLWYQYVLD